MKLFPNFTPRHLITHTPNAYQGHIGGLGDFEIKTYRMAPKLGGKRYNFAITTDEQWKLEFPSMLDGTGNEINSMYVSALRLLDENCYERIGREISSSESKDSPGRKYKGLGRGVTTSCLHETTRFQQSGLDCGTRERF